MTVEKEFLLIRNLILIILYNIVSTRPEIQEAVPDNLQHVSGCFLIRGSRTEPAQQEFDGLASETREAGIEHQRYQRDDGFVVRPKKYFRIKNCARIYKLKLRWDYKKTNRAEYTK